MRSNVPVLLSIALLYGCGGGMYGAPSATYTAPRQDTTAEAPDPQSPIVLTNEADVRIAQDRLARLNFYRGPLNGVWGSETQAAAEEFQRARGLAVGPVNRATLNALELETVPLKHSGPVGGTRGLAGMPNDAAAGPNETRVGAVVDSRTGVGMEPGQQPVEASFRPSGPTPQPVSPATLSRVDVSDLQLRLRDEGLYRGELDGIWGPLSQQALIDFQSRNGLTPDGRIDAQTASALGVDLQRLTPATSGGELRRLGPSGSTIGDVRPPSPSYAPSPSDTFPGETRPYRP